MFEISRKHKFALSRHLAALMQKYIFRSKNRSTGCEKGLCEGVRLVKEDELRLVALHLHFSR